MISIEKYLRHLLLGLGEDLTDSNLELFYHRQYQDYLLTKSKLIINGKKVSGPQKTAKLIEYATLNLTKRKNFNKVKINDIVETSGIVYTEETFIEQLIDVLSTNVKLKNIKLIEQIKIYKKFLRKKLRMLQKIEIQLENESNDRNKLLSDKVVYELHKEFNDKNVIWEGNISLQIFLGYFDIENVPISKMTYVNDRVIIYILREIRRMNNAIALRNFNIKDYKQKKSQSKTRAPKGETSLSNSIRAIIKKG